MNEKKISFIICTNDEFYMQECRFYLNELIVPDGMDVDVIEVKDAKSMTAGCNAGMKSSDAKYKVYLHQDVFIRNRNFIQDILNIFYSDEKIGLIGLVGTPYLCKSATMWQGVRYGGFYKLEEYMHNDIVHRFFPIEEGYLEVDAVDGLLIATQYDIPWREDVFQKWDFYDVSQCFEFIKAGYKAVVPGQSTDWYYHDCGAINFSNYAGERQLFLKEYNQYMSERENQNWDTYLSKVRESVIKGYHGPEEEKQRLLSYLDTIGEE